MKFFTIFLLLSSLMLGGIYYTLSSTSIPYDALVSVLNQQEWIAIEGVRGSLRTGIELDKVDITDEESGAKFYLKNFKASYDSFKEEGNKKVILIKNVSLDAVEIVGSDNTETTTTTSTTHTSSNQSDSDPMLTKEEKENVEIRIDNIAIKNAVFKQNRNSTGFKLDLFHLKDMVINNDGVAIKKIQVTSNVIDLSGHSSLIEDSQTEVSLKGIVKAKDLQSVIKDLPFKFDFRVKDRILKLDATAFDDKFTVKIDPKDDGVIAFNDLDLSSYVDKEYELNKVTGEFGLPAFNQLDITKLHPKTDFSFEYKGKKYTALSKDYTINLDEGKSTELSLIAKSAEDKIKLRFLASETSDESGFFIEQID